MRPSWEIFAVGTGLFALVIGACCTPSLADERCDHAYQNLKKFEAQHPIDSDAALAALRKGDHCSKLVLEFEDQVDANAKIVAEYARDFVAACTGDPTKGEDLAFYSLDAVLHPPPSTLRARCNLSK